MAAGVGVAIGTGRKDASPAHAATGAISSFSATSGNIVANKVTYSSGKGNGTTDPIISSNTLRIYKPASGQSDGGFITVTAASGVTLSSVTFTNSDDKAGLIKTKVDSGSLSSSESLAKSAKKELTGLSASSVSIYNAGSDRLSFAGISVVYSEGSTPSTYTVTYNPVSSSGTGSGTITDSNSPYNSGAQVTVLDSTGFTAPSGKEFSHWYTTSTGTGGTSYNPGDKFTISANTTLYAQWINETGTKLTFDVSSNPGGWPTTNETTLTDYTYTLSDVDYTFSLMNVKCNSGYLMCTATAVLGLPAIQGKKLTKVVTSNSSQCSTSVVVGVSSSSSSFSAVTGGANQTWSTQSSSYTYSLSNTTINTQYYLYITNKNAQILSLVLTYEDVQTYTATFEVDSNCTGYGTLSSSSITYITPGATIGVSGNKVTIGSSSVTATATSQTTQYSYAFSSWSVSDGDTVDSNITITATFSRTTRSYDVTFNMQEHGEAITKQTIAYGGTVTQPSPAPEATGYTFGGWYKESSCSNVWNFNTDTVSGTTVLYAKWTINNYTVSFDLNGHEGSAPASQTISYGGKAAEPSPAPTDTQYNFVGWFKEAQCTNEWNFSTDTVSGDTVLYASWAIKTFDITLASGSHGSLTGTTTVNYGTLLSVTLTPDSGYGLPDSLTGITMDGNDILSQVTYSAGSITGPAITGDIVISAECVLLAKTFQISTTVSNNGTSSGDTSITDLGGTATVNVTAGSGYKLPDSISVSGANHTYVKSDKYHATISLSNVTLQSEEQQVVITVTCVVLTSYNIDFTDVENADHSGASTITEDGTATIVITPHSGYYSPETASVTVTNATKTSWTKATNTLVISNPSGAVSISYTPDVNTLTGITLSEEEGDYELGDPLELPTVTASYSHISDQELDDSDYSVTGSYNPYVVGDYELTISYTYAGHTESETYTAHVTAVEVETVSSWIKQNSLTAGTFLITTSNDSGDHYYIPTGLATAASPTPQSFTVDGEGNITSTVSSSNVWTIEATTGGYYIHSGDNYLYTTGSNSGVRVNTLANADGTGVIWNLVGGDEEPALCNNYGRYLGWYNSSEFRCYTSRHGNLHGSDANFVFYAYHEEQTGSEDLIRITGEYTGDPKYIGNTVAVSDFLIKKQYNTGDTLTTLTSEEMATVTIVSGATLLDEDNIVRLSYTEGGITKTADVPVSATEVTAELQSVTLTQGANVKKNYIYVSGIQWDFTDLNVFIDYDDNTFDQTLSLASLVQSGEATISPAAPSVGTTSFTVSYRYNDEMDISSATVSGITVREDYVASMSWTGTTESHFKAFSGGQLTAAQVGAWHVTPTFAGAGVGSELSFNQYTLKVGSKVISSLPYTWTSEDDGQELSITYGKDVDGKDFVKTNNTAVANICASINAIDHTEIIDPAWEEDIEGYYLVTDASKLAAGDSVVIVASDYSKAMSTTQNNNNRGETAVTKDGDSVDWTGSEVQTFTLEAGTSTGTFAFKTTDGYIYAASSGSNYLRTETTKSANSSWTISIDNGVATMLAQGSNTRNLLQYNNSNNIFACYAPTNAQKDVSIYKYVSDTIPHEAVTETTHYANQMEHFDAQKKVVEFAKFMNTTMNDSNVCSGTQENLETAWGLVAAKYAELITNNTKLSSDEKTWANNMLKYATPSWSSDEEAACVEKAMKTYDFCVAYHSDVCDEFLTGGRAVQSPRVSPLMNIIGENTNTVAIIVIISMVSVTAIGGYFFLRKRKEN